MIDDNADTLLRKAIYAEVENIKNKHGECYNSIHEGYAVLKEEIEEAAEEMERTKNLLAEIWQNCRNDEVKEFMGNAKKMNLYALYLMQEACQIAAVAEKIGGKIYE